MTTATSITRTMSTVRTPTAGHRTGIRRTAALAAVLLAGVLAASGCGPTDDDPPAGQSAGGLGTAPTPATTAAGPGDQGQPAAPPPATYPDTARAYAEAIVSAWVTPDVHRLADLTNAQVNDQLLQIPGPPSPDWTFIECDLGHYCSFYNSNGDLLNLLIPAASVGTAQAAAQVSYNETTYPTDAVDYVREFVGAWQNGNVARMHKLALPEVVEVFDGITPAAVSAYGSFHIAPSLLGVMISGVGYEVEVHVRMMFLGAPQAIAVAIREI
jgi:predicted lipid-binding transport protein (Tim44 family)